MVALKVISVVGSMVEMTVDLMGHYLVVKSEIEMVSKMVQMMVVEKGKPLVGKLD